MAKSSYKKQADALASVIKKAAADENCDVDKLKFLLETQQNLSDKAAKAAFFEAMAECQTQMPTVVKDATNTETDSEYAKLETIQQTIKSCYTEHGFSLTFSNLESNQEGYIRFVGDVMHQEGYEKQYYMDLPIDEGSDNKMHGIGSANSYGRRYLTMNIFNVVVAGEDNDGNSGLEKWVKDILACEDPEKLSQMEEETKKNGLFKKLSRNFENRKADLTTHTSIDGDLVLPEYQEDKFKKAFPGWKKKILSGKGSAQEVIDMLSSRYTLSTSQKEKISGVK